MAQFHVFLIQYTMKWLHSVYSWQYMAHVFDTFLFMYEEDTNEKKPFCFVSHCRCNAHFSVNKKSHEMDSANWNLTKSSIVISSNFSYFHYTKTEISEKKCCLALVHSLPACVQLITLMDSCYYASLQCPFVCCRQFCTF